MFHRQRQEAEKAAMNDEDASGAGGAGSSTEGEQWTIPGRKRRRAKEKEAFPGVKLRKSSSTDAKTQSPAEEPAKAKSPSTDVSRESAEVVKTPATSDEDKSKVKEPVQSAPPAPKQVAKAAPAASSALGLVAYGSDSDDD